MEASTKTPYEDGDEITASSAHPVDELAGKQTDEGIG